MTPWTPLKLPLALALATALVACSGEPFSVELDQGDEHAASYPTHPISAGAIPDSTPEGARALPSDDAAPGSFPRDDSGVGAVDAAASSDAPAETCCGDTCTDATIRACVCDIDEWCCSNWDSTCVAKLALGCGACP